MKEKIIVKADNLSIIEMNGKKYRMKKMGTKIVDHKLHGGEMVFVPIDEEKLKNDIEDILDNIENAVDKRELLREVLNNMELDRLNKIKKLLKKQSPVKKTRGCFGITIGNGSSGEYIQLA
jgi:hypothetical protein